MICIAKTELARKGMHANSPKVPFDMAAAPPVLDT